MNTRTRIFATLSLVLVAGQAAAIPTLRLVAPTFSQVSGTNGRLNAGLIVEASTDLLVLAIGGGFTITCSTSALQITAERYATFSDFFGPRAVLRIPEVLPSTYPIPGWSSIPAGSCNGQCVMQYKGEARDETSLSVRVGGTGFGANFSLIPAGEQLMGNSVFTNICRTGRPQCCTAGCVNP
jgi:hypothetical protein